LTKNIGKGTKLKLKQLRIEGIDGKVKKNINMIDEIERVLINFNYNHYSKVKNSDAHKDRIMKVINKN